MKQTAKYLSCALVVGVIFNASAVQQDITVTADVDSTVSITKADGTALPDTVAMVYQAGRGLAPHSQNIKFWSNTANRNLNVSLAAAPSLLDSTGANPIPLSVRIDGTAITTTATSFAFATTFPSGITDGSRVMPMVISQTTPGVITNSGRYSGIVSLIVTQAAATGGTGG